ncbi:hypothetical protein M1146_04570, partial [Patescibacteria group bacterium]|nr:hypothetical protein [Patescibacteria group bacterium]
MVKNEEDSLLLSLALMISQRMTDRSPADLPPLSKDLLKEWFNQSKSKIYRPWMNCPDKQTNPLDLVIKACPTFRTELFVVSETNIPPKIPDDDHDLPLKMAILAIHKEDPSKIMIAVHHHEQAKIIIDLDQWKFKIIPDGERLVVALNQFPDYQWTFLRGVQAPEDRATFFKPLGEGQWLPKAIGETGITVLQSEEDTIREFCQLNGIISPRNISKKGSSIHARWSIETDNNKKWDIDLLGIQGPPIHSIGKEALMEGLFPNSQDLREFLIILRQRIKDWLEKKKWKGKTLATTPIGGGIFYPDTHTLVYTLYFSGDEKPVYVRFPLKNTLKMKEKDKASIVIKEPSLVEAWQNYRKAYKQVAPPPLVKESVKSHWRSFLPKAKLRCYTLERAMKPLKIDPKALFLLKAYLMKADMGTGKTESFKAILEQYPQDRFLIISHRRSLAANQSSRLGATNYLDDEGNIEIPNDPQSFCISIDSLYKLSPDLPSFPIVFIDEIEGILQHLTSGIIKKPLRSFRCFLMWLQRASLIIAADANASPSVSGLFLSQICAPENLNIDINLWRRPRNMRAYQSPSKKVFFGNLYAMVQSNAEKRLNNEQIEPFTFLSTTKSQIKEIHDYIKQNDPEATVMCITGEEKTEEQNLFLKDPNRYIGGLSYLLYSPALSTGFNIVTPRFHHLYCYITADGCGLDEIDQMLWRIRQYDVSLASLIYFVKPGKPLSYLECRLDEKVIFDHFKGCKKLTRKMINDFVLERAQDPEITLPIPPMSMEGREFEAMRARILYNFFRGLDNIVVSFESVLQTHGVDIYALESHPNYHPLA